jgi:hypothetical protein
MTKGTGMGFNVGDVVQYSNGGWCVHGIAVVRGEGDNLWANDTYWGDNEHSVPLEKLEGKPVIGNITTFSTQIPYPYEFDDFADEDRFYIPIGGGSAKMWVRKDTSPDREKVGVRLRYELQKAHDRVKQEARNVEYHTKQLMKFENKLDEYGPKEKE